MQLCKTDLHVHLDGSLDVDFIARRATARGIALPCPPEQLRDWLHARKDDAARDSTTGGPSAKEGGNWGVFDFW